MLKKSTTRATRICEAHRSHARIKPGANWFMRQKTLTRRLSTQLLDMRASVEKMLSQEEVDALTRASVLLRHLSNDFECANRLATKIWDQEKVDAINRENRRLDDFSAQHLDTLEPTELILYVGDIQALCNSTDDLLTVVIGHVPNFRPTFVTSSLRSAVDAITKTPTPDALIHLRRKIAQFLVDEMGVLSKPGRDWMTWKNWIDFRDHRANLRALVSSAQPGTDPGG